MKNTKGFTLIELLVVIAIIAILTTGAVFTFSGAQAKARNAVRKGDITILRDAIEAYATDNGGAYPPSDTTANFEAALENGFIQEVPNGSADYPYYYATNAAGTEYELLVGLETSDGTAAAAMTSDGGDQTDFLEAGSDTTLVTGGTGSGTATSGTPAVASGDSLLDLNS